MKNILLALLFLMNTACGAGSSSTVPEYAASGAALSAAEDRRDATRSVKISNDRSTGTAIMISDATGRVLCNLAAGTESVVELPLADESVRAYSYEPTTHTWTPLEVKVLPGLPAFFDSPTLQVRGINIITFARRLHPDRIGRVYAVHYEAPEED